jgi:hypothetical protein
MRTYHQQYAENLCANLTNWLKRKSRRISDEYVESALILMRIDLETVRSFLESLYSPDPRLVRVDFCEKHVPASFSPL